MFRMTLSMMGFVTVAASGCYSDDSQTISGRVAAGSFPEAVTQVRAVGNNVVFTAAVGSDGSFELALLPHDRYRIELISSVRTSELVFPRAAGAIDTTFFIADSSAPFVLGDVHYVRIPDLGGGGGDTGTGGGGDTGTGGGGDTGTGGGGDTGTKCGSDVREPDGGGTSGDGATADRDLPAAVGCDDGTGGGGDTGTGGGDTGTGGGGDTGTGGGGH